jgi:hypothetical protein
LGLAGDPNLLFIGFKRLDHFALDLVKDAAVIQATFDEIGFD